MDQFLEYKHEIKLPELVLSLIIVRIDFFFTFSGTNQGVQSNCIKGDEFQMGGLVRISLFFCKLK